MTPLPSVLSEALEALKECADDLECEIKARAIGELPRRIERDLGTVTRARSALTRLKALGGELDGLRGMIDQAVETDEEGRPIVYFTNSAAMRAAVSLLRTLLQPASDDR